MKKKCARNHFEIYGSAALSTITLLYNITTIRLSELFRLPKPRLCTHGGLTSCSPSPPHPPFCFLSQWIWLLQEPRVNGIPWNLTFRDHFAEYNALKVHLCYSRYQNFFWRQYCFMVRTSHILLTLSPIEGHLISTFWLWWTMSTWVYKYLFKSLLSIKRTFSFKSSNNLLHQRLQVCCAFQNMSHLVSYFWRDYHCIWYLRPRRQIPLLGHKATITFSNTPI